MKRYKPEQIVTLLRQIEVEIANGKTAPHAYKEAEHGTEVLFHRIYRENIIAAQCWTTPSHEPTESAKTIANRPS